MSHSFGFTPSPELEAKTAPDNNSGLVLVGENYYSIEDIETQCQRQIGDNVKVMDKFSKKGSDEMYVVMRIVVNPSSVSMYGLFSMKSGISYGAAVSNPNDVFYDFKCLFACA